MTAWQRVKELAEIGDLIQPAGEHSVEHVRDAGYGENDQGGNLVPVVRRTEENDHEHGNQEDTDHCQYIWNGPDIRKEFTETVFQDISASFMNNSGNRIKHSSQRGINPFFNIPGRVRNE